ncbi:MAG TPA: hypothetical protein VMY37_12095 [Thermoguttaceae bacterium]|nr:hypothetical protein [Thermoguttaceae bacterium]
MDHSKPLHDDVQFSLFHPKPTFPRWAQLPTKMQEATCELPAQMLIEYLAGRAWSSQQKESVNE